MTHGDCGDMLRATGFLRVHLFPFIRTLRHGMHDLKVWSGVEADGHMPTTTPGKTTSSEDQMNRLAKVRCNLVVWVTCGFIYIKA
jgi:hypothetical protein